jgi:hypothetical protein
MANNLPPPKMPPLPGLGGNQPKMPPPEVQNAINMASLVTHANGLLALLALEELARLRDDLKLEPLDFKAAAEDIEFLPPEFEKQAHPGVFAFEKQARGLAGAKLRALAEAHGKDRQGG